jgi:hypothetical protein
VIVGKLCLNIAAHDQPPQGAHLGPVSMQQLEVVTGEELVEFIALAPTMRIPSFWHCRLVGKAMYNHRGTLSMGPRQFVHRLFPDTFLTNGLHSRLTVTVFHLRTQLPMVAQVVCGVSCKLDLTVRQSRSARQERTVSILVSISLGESSASTLPANDQLAVCGN